MASRPRRYYQGLDDLHPVYCKACFLAPLPRLASVARCLSRRRGLIQMTGFQRWLPVQRLLSPQFFL